MLFLASESLSLMHMDHRRAYQHSMTGIRNPDQCIVSHDTQHPSSLSSGGLAGKAPRRRRRQISGFGQERERSGRFEDSFVEIRPSTKY